MHIKTLHGNDYYFSSTIPQILLIHPIVVYLLALAGQGIELEKWINQLDENPEKKGTGELIIRIVRGEVLKHKQKEFILDISDAITRFP